jgi:hypothetical protein
MRNLPHDSRGTKKKAQYTSGDCPAAELPFEQLAMASGYFSTIMLRAIDQAGIF